MERLCVQGVIKNGQVELEAPIDLPDGTAVTVIDSKAEDIESTGPTRAPSPEVVKEIMLGILKRPDLMNDPNWKEKIWGPHGQASTPARAG